MQIKNIIMLTSILALALSASLYKKVMVDNQQALCLDGTKGAYYISEGSQKTKFLLNFQGGGWCGSSQSLSQTVDDCYSRSKTALGSSSSYADSFSYWDGILGDASYNYFKDWTKVYLKYCDGTGHQGYKKDPVSYKGVNLYFRGHNVTIGQLNSIDKSHRLFSSASEILVTGQSAGGLASYLWTNYIAERAPKNAKIWSMPDSGIFLDSTNTRTKQNDYSLIIQNFMKISNEEIDPPTKQCVQAHRQQKWKCMFAQHNHYFIKYPLFAIQSLYDSWSIPQILGIYCQNGSSFANCNETQMLYIQQYHQNTSQVLKEIGKKSINGYWAPTCSNHCYNHIKSYDSPSFEIPQNSKYTLAYSVDEWMRGDRVNYEHMDTGSWPSNKPCSGITQSWAKQE